MTDEMPRGGRTYVEWVRAPGLLVRKAGVGIRCHPSSVRVRGQAVMEEGRVVK